MAQRRTFSAEFKTKVVLELIAGKKSLSEASREYEIKDTVLSRWKQEFLERAGEIFEQPKDLQDKDARIAELERLVGRLTMQAELSKKAQSYASSLLKNREPSSTTWWSRKAAPPKQPAIQLAWRAALIIIGLKHGMKASSE